MPNLADLLPAQPRRGRRQQADIEEDGLPVLANHLEVLVKDLNK